MAWTHAAHKIGRAKLIAFTLTLPVIVCVRLGRQDLLGYFSSD
jgi:hypothetical protein